MQWHADQTLGSRQQLASLDPVTNGHLQSGGLANMLGQGQDQGRWNTCIKYLARI